MYGLAMESFSTIWERFGVGIRGSLGTMGVVDGVHLMRRE